MLLASHLDTLYFCGMRKTQTVNNGHSYQILFWQNKNQNENDQIKLSKYHFNINKSVYFYTIFR